jgi:hypothetical protein
VSLSVEWKKPREVDYSEVTHAKNYLSEMSKRVRECDIEGCCEGLVLTTRYDSEGKEGPAVYPCECRQNALKAFKELKKIAGPEWEEHVTHRMMDWSPEKRRGDPPRPEQVAKARALMSGFNFDAPPPDRDEPDPRAAADGDVVGAKGQGAPPSPEYMQELAESVEVEVDAPW